MAGFIVGACALGMPLAARATGDAAGSSMGQGGPSGPASPGATPIPTATPSTTTTVEIGKNGVTDLAAAGVNMTGDYTIVLKRADPEVLRRARLAPWTMFVQAGVPGLVSIGAERELPYDMHVAAAMGMIYVAPTAAAEIQLPSLHAGPARFYAAAAGSYIYLMSNNTSGGPSARAVGFGPKLGFDVRLPYQESAKHGWHIGADAGILLGDWSKVFGANHKKSMPEFTPIRAGYYW